jgi:transcriptional regulator with XRE-family HTH domain
VPAQPARGQRGPRIVGDLSGRAPTAERLMYGETLRRLRRRTGLTEEQVGELTGFSASKISRYERGYHNFKEPVLRRLFAVYRVTDPQEVARLLHQARQANERGWWGPYSDVSTKALQMHVSLEDMAERIRSYEMAQLQGLLQIPDYTRALVRANSPDRSDQETDRIVELRQLRQQRFLDHSGATLLCVVDEVTLVRGYGSDAVMRRQLEHLLALTEHPRLWLRMIELAGRNRPVQLGSMTVFDFAGNLLPTIVYTERPGRGEYLEDSDLVDEQVRAFDRLQAASLDQHACRRRIRHHLGKSS